MPRPAANKIAADDPSLLPSDDEDDDFVLSDAASESSDSDSEDEDGNKKGKKSKVKVEEVVKEPVMTKEAVDDLWASFNAADDDPYAAPKASTSADASSSSALAPSTSTAGTTATTKAIGNERKKVKIQVEYQFVGETVVQDKEVWSDSPEAISFFSKQQKPLPVSAPTPTPTPSSSNATSALDPDSLFGPSASSSSTVTSTAEPSTSSNPNPVPVPSNPIPNSNTNAGKKRKAGGGLNALAAELGVRPQKLNTLEKSKLDWNKSVPLPSSFSSPISPSTCHSFPTDFRFVPTPLDPRTSTKRTIADHHAQNEHRYVTKESLEDDLTKARKDGYLEKQDFLQRTEDRREEGYEKFKAGGRR